MEGTEFTLRAPWGSRRIRSAMPGRHLVPHALAAITVAEHFAVPMSEVEAALARGSRAEHRMAVLTAASGATVIDDTYNASPVSVGAALDFLARDAGGRRSQPLRGAGRHAGARSGRGAPPSPDRRQAAASVDGLVAVGERGRWIAEAAQGAGLGRVATAPDADAALEAVERTFAPADGDVLLVKGSRGVELDRLVDALRGRRARP